MCRICPLPIQYSTKDFHISTKDFHMNDKLFYGYSYIYEVYKTKSFSRAAENLFISQSSLSSTIRKLEKRIGVDIFDRSTTPIGLTEYGVEYIKAVEKIMDIETDFQANVLKLSELTTGQLTIGGSSMTMNHTLPSIISRFSQKYPGVSLRLVEGGSNQLEKQLSDGMLDLVIDNRAFSEEHFTSIPLFSEQLVLAVPKKHPLNEELYPYRMTLGDTIAKRHCNGDFQVVPLDHFRDENFLLLRSGNDTRQRAERICQNYGFTPRIGMEVDQQFTAYSLASYGIGLAFISDWVVQHMRFESTLYFYRLPTDLSTRHVSIFYKSSRYLTNGMREFIRIAEEAYPSGRGK